MASSLFLILLPILCTYRKWSHLSIDDPVSAVGGLQHRCWGLWHRCLGFQHTCWRAPGTNGIHWTSAVPPSCSAEQHTWGAQNSIMCVKSNHSSNNDSFSNNNTIITCYAYENYVCISTSFQMTLIILLLCHFQQKTRSLSGVNTCLSLLRGAGQRFKSCKPAYDCTPWCRNVHTYVQYVHKCCERWRNAYDCLL